MKFREAVRKIPNMLRLANGRCSILRGKFVIYFGPLVMYIESLGAVTCNYYLAIKRLLLDRIPNFRLHSNEFFLIMNFQKSYHLITLERHFTNSHHVLRSYISLDRSSACEAESVKLFVSLCMPCYMNVWVCQKKPR